MSGLFGIVDYASPVSEKDILSMSQMLSHRGKGEPGIWSGEYIALGFLDSHALEDDRRANEQPVFDSASGTVLAFDGRIDNRQELQEKLNSRESVYARLVLEGYLRRGVDMFQDLQGDFALIVWDVSRDVLILARDPIGLKPLFYYKDSRRFIFASEAKAILNLPEVRRAPDEKFLRAFDSARLREHAPTFFEGIYRVRPGEYVTVHRGGLHHHQYWKPDIHKKIKRCSDEEYRNKFKKLFYSAVETRLPENGKVAVFLSGGLDSSSVTAVAADILREKKNNVSLETFSLISKRFPDERKYSQCVVDAYRLHSEMVNIDDMDLKTPLEELVFEQECPFVDSYDIFFRELMKKASLNNAGVLLTGDWGDELMFSGAYLADLILEGKWRTFISEFPLFCRYEQAAASYVLKRLFWYLAAPRFHTPKYKTRAQKELYESVFYPANVLIMETMERAAAYAGLELRMPFLDMRLFEFLIETPVEQRMKNGLGKIFLRESLKGVLPDRIARRTEKIDYTVSLLHRLQEAGFVQEDLDSAMQELGRTIRKLWHKRWFGANA